MRETLRPAILTIIVAVYLVFGAAYAIKTPIWETPDEPAHFNYVRYLTEHLELPILQTGDYDQGYLEKLKANKFPSTMSVDTVRYESWQPPLYYALATPLSWVSHGLSLRTQVTILRFFSVFLAAILLIIAYKVARQIFPKNDLLALAVPGFIAVLPQHIAMTAAVSNDTLAEVIISIILLVLLRHVSEPATPSNSVLLGILLGAALLTKSTIYIGAALIVLALLIGEYNASGHIRVSELARQLVVVFGIGLLISGWWFVRNALVYGGLDIFGSARHDMVVQGQPLTGAFNLAYAKFFATSTLKSFWAQFGWMGVLADKQTYTLLGVLTAVAVVGLALFVLRVLRNPADSLTRIQGLRLVLMGAAFILVLGIMVGYNFRYIQAQGRYLFPAIVPIAIFLSLGLQEIIAARYASLFFASLYLALLALDYISLTRLIIPQLTG